MARHCTSSAIAAFALPLLISLDACAGSDPAPEPCSPAAMEAKMRAAIASADAESGADSGYLLVLSAPKLGLDLQAASDGVDPDAPFRIASIGKTFTAAAVLRLVEQGELDVDASLARVLPGRYAQMLREDGYDTEQMTVRHLLNHDAGLFDYAMSEQFIAAVLAEPSHRWTREEQVALAMQYGAPLAEPGALYAYSDTGYVLLGAIIEDVTGEALAPAMRDLLRFDALGLESTWLESFEPAPANIAPHAPQVFEGADLFSFDASLDGYGGGGYVSTARELLDFYSALLNGRIFDSPATLDTMLTIPAVNADSHYGMGIVTTGSCWTHYGFWSTTVAYCPEYDIGIAAAGMSPEDIERLTPMVQEISLDAVACQEPAQAGTEP